MKMGQPSRRVESFIKTSGRWRQTLAVAGAGPLGLFVALFFVLSPAWGAEQVNVQGTAASTHKHGLIAADHDANRQAPTSANEPEDKRLQVHTHHAELLGEKAYKDAPADVVLWGDLARALVVRKGSTFQTTFLPPVLALDGKTISIIGHVTRISETNKPGKQFLLSSQAFLCDECAPPEATELVEVNTRNVVNANDGIATVRGQFELVKDDSKGLVYRLNNAVILKQQD